MARQRMMPDAYARRIYRTHMPERTRTNLRRLFSSVTRNLTLSNAQEAAKNHG